MNVKTENTRNDSSNSHSEKENAHKLTKKLFYACEKCDGALVQLATCILCKRAVLRICVRCQTVSDTEHICMRTAASSKCFEDLEMKN